MRHLHDDELVIDADLVRRLVARAVPEYAGLPVRPLTDSGSSNALFRLGDELLVRLPRQPGGGASVLKEARWGPVVAPRLPVAVPEVIAVGEPGLGYPERWSITGWLPGRPATAGGADGAGAEGDGAGSVALGVDLARFVAALRAVGVPEEVDAELEWYRGGALPALDQTFREALAECRALDLDLDLDRAPAVWEGAVVAAGRRVPERRWFHGDLLAENLLVDDGGRLAAVLDLGGLGVGDPAVDLVVAWEVLDARGRAAFRDALGVDDATWLVGRGWALLIALITFPYYGATMPRRCADRAVMARAVLADTPLTPPAAPRTAGAGPPR